MGVERLQWGSRRGESRRRGGRGGRLGFHNSGVPTEAIEFRHNISRKFSPLKDGLSLFAKGIDGDLRQA